MSTQTWLEIFGWIGSVLVVWSLTQAKVLRFRWLNLSGALAASIYNAIIGVWPFFAMNLAITFINIYWLTKLYSKSPENSLFKVIEVPSDDAYLNHVLNEHGSDIALFEPRYANERAVSRPDFSFLLLRNDEMVGVVELADDGDGTARVLLDWVTPRFRNADPGRFVYLRSGALTTHGFTRVVAPAVPHFEKYLSVVGFTRTGDQWMLDLPATTQSQS